MKIVLLFIVLGLSACGNMKNIQSPDFDKSEIQAGISISCSGYKKWTHCYEAAEKTCPNGYTVINKEENLVMQARTLRIECKK